VTEHKRRHAPTVTGFAINCAIAVLRKQNIADGPLLQRTSLSEYDFDDPHVRVPAADQGEFLERAAEAIGDAAFGFHLAEHANPREIGLLFYTASAAQNLGETLPLFLRYSRLVNEALRLKAVRQSTGVIVEFDFVGVSQQCVRQNTEFWLGVIVKATRGMTGRRVCPTRVAFPHVHNVDSRQFERFCGCPVEFGAPSGQLAYSNETLALPLITHDPHLLKLLQPIAEEAATARRMSTGSVRASVENVAQRLLPLGRVRVETVAKVLAVSVRTLSRRLSVEGTTFAEVVDQLRRSLAIEYPKEQGASVSQAAWQLGYESPSSLTKAFKRWTGRSPSAARNEHRGARRRDIDTTRTIRASRASR
jgi:AraC-like DNA-binding protein